MPPVGQVGGVAEYPIAAPRHDMRCPRHDLEGAPGAQVRFKCLFGRNRLNVPQAVSTNLTATPPREQVVEADGFVVVVLLLGFAASGSIAARHGSSLKCGPAAERQVVPAGTQYQPEAWDFCHAPHGVP